MRQNSISRKSVLMKIVNENPGIRFNEIMRMSGIRNGSLSHHIKKLNEEGLITVEITPRITRIYPIGISSVEAKLCRILSKETQRRIILFILEKEVVTSQQIRDHIKKSSSVVSVNLTELFKQNIIEKQYDIPSNKYSLKNTEQVKGVLKEYYPNLREKMTENIIEMLNF